MCAESSGLSGPHESPIARFVIPKLARVDPTTQQTSSEVKASQLVDLYIQPILNLRLRALLHSIGEDCWCLVKLWQPPICRASTREGGNSPRTGRYEYSATEQDVLYRLIVQLFPRLRYQTDDQKREDGLTENKHRRVQHEHEPRGVIQEVRKVTRVAGVGRSRQSPFSCTKRELNLLQLVSSYLESRICICLTSIGAGRW